MAAGQTFPAMRYVLTRGEAEACERLSGEPGGRTRLLLVVSLAASTTR